VLVQPATVARWHREGFRGCWSRRSRRRTRVCSLEVNLYAETQYATRESRRRLRPADAICPVRSLEIQGRIVIEQIVDIKQSLNLCSPHRKCLGGSKIDLSEGSK